MNRTLVTTLTALLSAGLAHGQEPPKASTVSAELAEALNTDQIQAASKKMQDTASAPADAVILRSSELRALGYRTLGDALGGVVGFRTNEDHAYQGLAVRGLYVLGDQNTRVLVLLDGHALNNPAEVGSSKVGQDFGLPMELVDHIEIVRGPASSLYGNNAFMALVNVVSVDAASSRHSSIEGAVGVGPGGAAEAWVDGGGTLGGVKISLMASGFGRRGTSQTYPQLGSVAPEYGQPLPAASDHEDRQSAYFRLAAREWSFAATYLNRVQRLASGPFGFKPGDNGTAYTNKRLSGDFRWQPSVDRVQWLVRLFGDRSEFQDAFVPDPTRDATQGETDKDPDWSLGAELQARMSLGDRFALTLGSEQRFHHFTDSTVAGSQIASEVKYRIGNTYLEGSFQADEHWTLVVGIQEAEYDPSLAKLTVNGVSVTSMTVAGTGEVIPFTKASIRRETPRLSVIFTPDQADVLKLIYGQGFRFPTLFEAYYSDADTFYPNAQLKPEVLTSEQLSWSRRWSPLLRSQISASLFQWDHLIQAGYLGDGQQFQNEAERIQGRALEAELNLNLSPTTISGGFGWYRWDQGAQSLNNTSTWNAVLKAIHHLEAWSIAGEARYVGGRETAPDPAVAADPGTRVPANLSIRASLRYDRWKWWLQATLEDATNGQRKDLVAKDYAPITWMKSDGRALWLQAGFRF
ncbi:MAG TPA: TonB-dependent receptor [Geothrix sp.]|nr:TonB-dependent receptor [Geothrix sp.]